MTNQRELNSSFVVDTKKFSLSKLKYTVSELERYSFVDGKNSLDGKDILGDFFEGIIRDGFKQSKGVFANFTMRIRLKNCNTKFAYYYFRTTYFQYLIEIYKKGLGNSTNIFPIVIKEFPLPDISLDDQQRYSE